MIIGRKNYNINILVLFMEREVDVTIATVETLLYNIEDGVTISVLLNGGSRDDLRRLFTSSPHVYYYESAKNLGVAGGRNFLLTTDEAKASDIIMFLDNDVIPTTDYIESLASFLVSKKDAGIVGSTLLNVEHFLRHHSDSFEEDKGPFGGRILSIDNQTVRSIIQRDFSTYMFYHIGSNPNWYDAYFSSKDLYENILVTLGSIRRKRFHAQMKFDKQYSFRYLINRRRGLEASNIGGGCQAFFRRIVDEIGLLNDVFSPFGYEDVDFCIRAIKRGYKNYADTNTFLLHGTDYRQGKRHEFNLAGKFINEYRCLTLLYYLNFPDIYDELIKRRILYHYVDKWTSGLGRSDEYLYFFVKGYLQGKEQIIKQNISPYLEDEKLCGNVRR